MRTLVFFLFAITLAMPVTITVFAEDAPKHEMVGAPGHSADAQGQAVADKMHERNMDRKMQHDEEMKKKHAKHQEMMKKMMDKKKHEMQGNMPDKMNDKMPEHMGK